MKRILLSIILLFPLLINAQEISIPDAREIDADGVMVRLGETGTVTGITVGFNFRPGAATWVVFDTVNNVGLGVFSLASDFGYEFKPGDEVSIEGTLSQFNGLSQITADTLFLLSEGNPVPDAASIAGLDEFSESRLVVLEDVTLVDPSQWQTTGSFNVDVTNGITVNQVRIDADTDISGRGAPTGVFSITGVGGQFDNESPFLQGYQLFPRSSADIDPYIEEGVEFTPLEIAAAREVDQDGVAVFDGQNVELTGFALSINFRPGGLQFALVNDNNIGIGVFSNDNDFGITDLVQGTEYTIQGNISQFNGLTQINVESIEATGNSSGVDVTEVSQLGEDTESSLVQLTGWSYVDASQWLGDGSSFNVDITDGFRTEIMRIDADTELSSMSAPALEVVKGIGGQFDNESPFLDGYQILPRFASDIFVISSVTDLISEYELSIYPNPASDMINIDANTRINSLSLMSLDGKLLNKVQANQMNIQSITPGTYIIGVEIDNQIIQMPIIKQ